MQNFKIILGVRGLPYMTSDCRGDGVQPNLISYFEDTNKSSDEGEGGQIRAKII